MLASHTGLTSPPGIALPSSLQQNLLGKTPGLPSPGFLSQYSSSVIPLIHVSFAEREVGQTGLLFQISHYAVYLPPGIQYKGSFKNVFKANL